MNVDLHITKMIFIELTNLLILHVLFGVANTACRLTKRKLFHG